MIIMTTLEQRGSASVAELARQFGVSEVTIRKDLDVLADSGLIERSHGGALLKRDRPFTLSYDVRGAEFLTEKEAIGRAAASLAKDMETILIDCGTTTIHLAKNLGPDRALYCMTNDLQIALTLAVWPQIRATLTAGAVRGLTMPLWGPDCRRSILALHEVEATFLSISGLSPERGLTNTYSVEVNVKRAMIQVAREVILLVDSSKFGKVAPAFVAELSTVHKIVTGRQAPVDMVERISAMGIEVMLV
jgi:DeoR family transcriptional regulator, fructose operon transcriptional repressor